MKKMIRTRFTPPTDSEQGTALVLAMFLGVLAVGLAVSGTQFMKSYRSKTEASFVLAGQSGELADSGITEALNWFRLQNAQPVLAFNPLRDDLADPQVLDTDDPEIGLVRSYQIDGSLWGRSEIWKEWDADPDSSRLAWRQKMQATDISDRRNAAPGSVWRIRCVGYVYRRVDPDKAFDEAPNRVLGTEIHEAEIRRLNLTLPAAAAVSTSDGDQVYVGTNGVIDGGGVGAAVAYEQGKAAPLPPSGEINGGSSPIPSYNDAVRHVFDARVQDLRGLADTVVTDENLFPSPMQNKSFIYSDSPDMVLVAPNSLIGFGLMYHQGNLTLEAGTNFSGLLYVDGDLTINSPSEIKGSVIATGSIFISGTGDFSKVVYDPNVITALQEMYGQYRFSSPVRISN